MNLAAFYPPHAKKFYPWIEESQVGLVLAMFQVAYLTCSPIVGQNLQRIGRKNSILIGYILCITATVGFGAIANIPVNSGSSNDKLFFGLSITTRFIQGMGDSMVATAAYSIVSIEFPTGRDKYVGLCQTAVGIGLLAGPFIGQTIFNIMQHFGEIRGYEYTFYVLAVIF